MKLNYQACAIQHELMKKYVPKVIDEPLFCFEKENHCATFSRDVGRGNKTTVLASERLIDQTLFAVKVRRCHNQFKNKISSLSLFFFVLLCFKLFFG